MHNSLRQNLKQIMSSINLHFIVHMSSVKAISNNKKVEAWATIDSTIVGISFLYTTFLHALNDFQSFVTLHSVALHLVWNTSKVVTQTPFITTIRGQIYRNDCNAAFLYISLKLNSEETLQAIMELLESNISSAIQHTYSKTSKSQSLCYL